MKEYLGSLASWLTGAALAVTDSPHVIKQLTEIVELLQAVLACVSFAMAIAFAYKGYKKTKQRS